MHIYYVHIGEVKLLYYVKLHFDKKNAIKK